MKRCAYWYAAFSFCHNSAQSMRLTSTTLPLCSQVSFNSDVIIRFYLLIDHACDTEYIGRYASRERCDLGLLGLHLLADGEGVETSRGCGVGSVGVAGRETVEMCYRGGYGKSQACGTLALVGLIETCEDSLGVE